MNELSNYLKDAYPDDGNESELDKKIVVEQLGKKRAEYMTKLKADFNDVKVSYEKVYEQYLSGIINISFKTAKGNEISMRMLDGRGRTLDEVIVNGARLDKEEGSKLFEKFYPLIKDAVSDEFRKVEEKQKTEMERRAAKNEKDFSDKTGGILELLGPDPDMAKLKEVFGQGSVSHRISGYTSEMGIYVQFLTPAGKNISMRMVRRGLTDMEVDKVPVLIGVGKKLLIKMWPLIGPLVDKEERKIEDELRQKEEDKIAKDRAAFNSRFGNVMDL